DTIEKSKVQHPGAAGDCMDCHNSHASRQPGLPKTNAVDICLTCHSDQAELAKKHTLHQPAFKQGCATCHEPHGGENNHLLRAKTANGFCLECYGPDSKPKKLESDYLLAIFDGKVRLPEDYFSKNKVMVLPIKFGRGHPVDAHPVADLPDPTDVTKVRAKIDCLSCHQPHASAQSDLLVKDRANNRHVCSSCDKK